MTTPKEKNRIEHIQTEKALQESEQRFKMLAEASFEGIVLSEKGLIVDLNDQQARMHGYERNELIGKQVQELVAPESRSTVAEVIRSGNQGPFEFLDIRKDGKTFPVEVRVRVVKTADQDLHIATIRDITERKRAEEALRTSEAQLSNALKIAHMGHWEYDVAKDLFTFNDNFYRIFRTTVEREGGYTMSSARYAQRFVHPDEIPVVGNEIKKTIESTDPHFSRQLEHRIIYADGGIGHIAVRFFIVKDEQGRTVKTYGVNQDITERKLAEEKLRYERQLLRTLIDNLPDAVYVKDAKCRKVIANLADVRNMQLQSEDEVLGKDDFELFPKELAEGFFADDQTVIQTGQPVINREEFVFDENGEKHWLSTSKMPLRDEKGEIIGLVGVGRNITERKLSEEKIAEQSFFLDSALDPIIVQDLNENLIFYNKAAERLYGWTFEEAKSLTIHQPIATEDHAKFDRGIKEFAEKGECAIELRQKTKNGRTIITHSRWSVARNREGDPYGRLIITRDITEQRNLEAQLRRSQRMESLGTLAGGIAHDLNNVLAPILMSVQILRSKITDPNLKKLIAALETSTKRGSDIIKQVLTFARGTEKDFAPQQLRYIISEIEAIIRQTFPKNIQLRTRVSKDLSLVLGDATQLNQVLMNLCINARDAMLEGGRLTVTAEDMYMDESYAHLILDAHPGQYVMLTVADTGTGIPLDVQEKVFEPFFTTKERGKGTGLGLSSVYTIVKSHNGLIKLYSEYGKGTELKIFLPATQQKEQKPESVSDKELLRGHGERILVIDDELFVLQISKEVLEIQGYSVVTAMDGAEATALFASSEKGSIQLIITDMNMPLMDGSSTIRALRRLDPDLKIIVSSGLLTNVNSAGLGGLDTQGYLTKPYTAEQLLLMVQKVLNAKTSTEPKKS